MPPRQKIGGSTARKGVKMQCYRPIFVSMSPLIPSAPCCYVAPRTPKPRGWRNANALRVFESVTFLPSVRKVLRPRMVRARPGKALVPSVALTPNPLIFGRIANLIAADEAGQKRRRQRSGTRVSSGRDRGRRTPIPDQRGLSSDNRSCRISPRERGPILSSVAEARVDDRRVL